MKNIDLKTKVKILSEAQKSFYFFTTKIFAESFTNFTGGSYIKECCDYLQKYDRTMRVAARSHFKSTSFYSYVLFKIMFQGFKQDLSIRYYSFNDRLAGWHIQQIKSLIDKNPYFEELKNLKPLAENVAAYTWDGKHVIRIRPSGIISFTRGAKDNIILCDDLFSDPSNPIHPTLTLKISDIFRSVILEALKPGGEIHVAGSTISRADIYFDPEIQKEFHVRFYPGITRDKEGNEVPTWPEFYTLEQLKAKIPVMGEKAFSAEVQCNPYYSTDSYFKKEKLRKEIVNESLRNIPIIEGFKTDNLVVAGWDLGKKKHPSVLNVFEIRKGKAIHIHRKSVRNWGYYSGETYDPLKPTQLEYVKEAIRVFGIDYVFYDSTRGELEGASDLGLLSPQFVPVVFTSKKRVQMATDFGKVVLNRQLELLNDEEMLTSICSVTNDLVSMETGTQHSDDFWSVALALQGFNKMGASEGKDREVSVGGGSMFEEGKKIPKGW